MNDEKKEQNQVLLICSLADDPFALAAVGEPFEATCGHAVRASQAGHNLLAEHPDAEVYCLPCFQVKAQEIGEIPEVRTAPGAEEELAEVVGKELADTIMTEAKKELRKPETYGLPGYLPKEHKIHGQED